MEKELYYIIICTILGAYFLLDKYLSKKYNIEVGKILDTLINKVESLERRIIDKLGKN